MGQGSGRLARSHRVQLTPSFGGERCARMSYGAAVRQCNGG